MIDIEDEDTVVMGHCEAEETVKAKTPFSPDDAGLDELDFFKLLSRVQPDGRRLERDRGVYAALRDFCILLSKVHARAWVSTTASKETRTEEDLPSANSIEPKDRKTQK